MSKESVAKYNHDAWIFPPTHKTPVRWHVTSRVVIGFVGICSKFWIGKFNVICLIIYVTSRFILR